MCVKSRVYDILQIWHDNVTRCDARLQFNIHAIVERVWYISDNQFRSWHIWHNYVTNLTNSDGSHYKMLYLCPVSISISVPFTPHLPQLKEVDLRLCCCCCECQKNTNRHYSTRPVCVSTLIPFYSIHKCVVACMSPSVCCEVIVVMSASWSVRAGISKQGDEI